MPAAALQSVGRTLLSQDLELQAVAAHDVNDNQVVLIMIGLCAYITTDDFNIARLAVVLPEAAAVMTPLPMVMLVPSTASSSRPRCILLLFFTNPAALSARGFAL